MARRRGLPRRGNHCAGAAFRRRFPPDTRPLLPPGRPRRCRSAAHAVAIDMTPFRRAALLFPFLLLLTAAAVKWLGIGPGEDLLIQRKYREAAAALQGALAEVPAGEQDRVLLLLARAQQLAGDPGAAIATLDRLVKEQQGSDLQAAGRFLAARAHEQQGDLQKAAALYRDEIEKLI